MNFLRSAVFHGEMDYVCLDPNATIRAANVVATLEAFQLLPHLIDEILPRYQLERAKLSSNESVPLSAWIQLLHEISLRVGPSKIREVGSKTIQNAFFPAHFDTVESVLLALDEIYRLNHTGNSGGYTSTRTSDGAVRVVCATPFPREFERGLVEGIARYPGLAKGQRFLVGYEDGPMGSNVTCVLTVRGL